MTQSTIILDVIWPWHPYAKITKLMASFYLFNPEDGLGAGSYVQEAVTAGTWYHYVAVVDMPTDTIRWYKNGVLQDQDSFMNSVYQTTPQNGTAPVRIGTKDFASYFKGALDNLYIYNRALSGAEVGQLCRDTTP
jgi:concanavalin A-like lectin/glucanase superfamily protein